MNILLTFDWASWIEYETMWTHWDNPSAICVFFLFGLNL